MAVEPAATRPTDPLHPPCPHSKRAPCRQHPSPSAPGLGTSGGYRERSADGSGGMCRGERCTQGVKAGRGAWARKKCAQRWGGAATPPAQPLPPADQRSGRGVQPQGLGAPGCRRCREVLDSWPPPQKAAAPSTAAATSSRACGGSGAQVAWVVGQGTCTRMPHTHSTAGAGEVVVRGGSRQAGPGRQAVRAGGGARLRAHGGTGRGGGGAAGGRSAAGGASGVDGRGAVARDLVNGGGADVAGGLVADAAGAAGVSRAQGGWVGRGRGVAAPAADLRCSRPCPPPPPTHTQPRQATRVRRRRVPARATHTMEPYLTFSAILVMALGFSRFTSTAVMQVTPYFCARGGRGRGGRCCRCRGRRIGGRAAAARPRRRRPPRAAHAEGLLALGGAGGHARLVAGVVQGGEVVHRAGGSCDGVRALRAGGAVGDCGAGGGGGGGCAGVHPGLASQAGVSGAGSGRLRGGTGLGWAGWGAHLAGDLPAGEVLGGVPGLGGRQAKHEREEEERVLHFCRRRGCAWKMAGGELGSVGEGGDCLAAFGLGRARQRVGAAPARSMQGPCTMGGGGHPPAASQSRLARTSAATTCPEPLWTGPALCSTWLPDAVIAGLAPCGRS